MGILLDAARAWNDLCKVAYQVVLGKKGSAYTLELTFEAADFPHLAGMQYARDVDFGLRQAQFYGEKLIPAILSGKLEEARLCKARDWLRIEGRLKAIVRLQLTLEGPFTVARFDPRRVRGFCRIQAEYVMKNTVSGETFFVFLDRGRDRYYCKSAFQSNELDYLENQSVMTVLEVTRRSGRESVLLRRHPGYPGQGT